MSLCRFFFFSFSSVPSLFFTTVRYCKTRYLTLWCGVESRDIECGVECRHWMLRGMCHFTSICFILV